MAISSRRAFSAQEGHTWRSIASVTTRNAAVSAWHRSHFTPILSDGEPLDISENPRRKPRTTDSLPWLCPVENDPRLRWVVSTERLLYRVSGISEHASPPVESLPFESLRAESLSKRWVERRSCTEPFVILGKYCFCSGFFFGSRFIFQPVSINLMELWSKRGAMI